MNFREWCLAYSNKLSNESEREVAEFVGDWA